MLIRHSSTVPGSFDPEGFQLGVCESQRNLSDFGKAHARRIGDYLSSKKIPIGRVLSSRFCRCLDTASLAFGVVEPWPILDNIAYDSSEIRFFKVDALVESIKRWDNNENLVLVTHGFNILEAIGVMPAQGEIVILAPSRVNDFNLLGVLQID